MKIAAKWGFGNAPLKKHHLEKTHKAIHSVLSILEAIPESEDIDLLEAISHVKGQFTRTIKQDQWDWYTVWSLLGRPSRTPALRISKQLGELRSALKRADYPSAEKIRDELIAGDLVRYLHNFLEGRHDFEQAANGFIYILSTRSQPQILKIGMTKRTVEERVKEINSATGVMIPYGIRAAWQVDDAPEVEREIHILLNEYRIRIDREFFELEFNKAFRLINDYLNKRRRQKKGIIQTQQP